MPLSRLYSRRPVLHPCNVSKGMIIKVKNNNPFDFENNGNKWPVSASIVWADLVTHSIRVQQRLRSFYDLFYD
jgi:hypothetical protein